MPCEKNTRDSNVVVLSIAEEECLKELPVAPIWYTYEPNTFGDFGSELTKVQRSFINPGRQRRKGRTVGEDASGSFNHDFVKSMLNRLMQGFMFADAREMPTTNSLVRVHGDDTVDTVDSTDGYAVTSAAAGDYAAGMLVLASGFGVAANNGLKVISSATVTSGTVDIVTTPAMVAETVPATGARLEVVGYQFGSAAVALTYSGGVLSMVGTGTTFTTMPNLIPGAWIFIGGDATAENFANNRGFARIATVADELITFDDLSFTGVTEAGTGKTIQIFIGPIIRNERSPALIKERSYQLERTLGTGPTSTQAEYLEGAYANELSIELPAEEKIAMDFSFVACARTYRTGETGDEIKAGTRIASPMEETYNTATDLYRSRITIYGANPGANTPLVGYASEGSITINNGATPNKALGIGGALDFQFGDFQVDATFTGYFTSVTGPVTIRNDADCGYNLIAACFNYGMILDMPLVSLSGGGLTVEKDAPITLAIESAAVESRFGYTLQYQYFPYLPDLAMPA